MPTLPPLINGKNYDWADIVFTALNVPFVGITKIEYSRGRESVNNYGAGNEPVSYGNKNFTYQGSITVFKDQAIAMQAAAPNKSFLEIPPFPASVIFGGNGTAITVDKLQNIRFTNDPFSGNQNDSVLYCTLTFVFAGLKH